MEPRISSPVLTVPGVMDALQALSRKATHTATQSGLPQATLGLVSVRASQINGCAVCLDMHTRAAKKAGETDERLATLAARANPVPDEVFEEAARHYHGPGLAALIVVIAAINAWNRLNVITGQVAGEWTA